MLHDMVVAADKDENVHVVIISGNGEDFSVSDDQGGFLVPGYVSKGEKVLEHWKKKDWHNWVSEGEPLYPFAEMQKIIVNSDKIFIAAVQGRCYCADLLWGMDFIVVADDARLSNPDILIGQVACSASTQTLPRLVGRRRALEVLLDPTPITAEDAYRCGLVNKIVPRDKLMEETEKWAQHLAQFNPKVVGMTKKLITMAGGDMTEALKKEQLYCGFSNALPGSGVPVGDWTTLMDYPMELLEGVDVEKGYAFVASED